MSDNVSGERFIISVGNFSFKDIITMMASALGKKPPHIRAGAFMTGLVWRAGKLKKILSGKHPMITKETATNASSISVYNNNKLLEAFPAFSYTPIGNTIENMARSFIISNQK